MSVDDAIVELVSDDLYLLWEVKAEATANGLVSLGDVIIHTLELLRKDRVSCWATSIDGKASAVIMRKDDAVLALSDCTNWNPPKLDSDVAFWLGSALLTENGVTLPGLR